MLLSTQKINTFILCLYLFNCSTVCFRTFQTSLLYIFTLKSLLQPPRRIYLAVQKSAQVPGCRVAQAVLLTFRNKQQEWRGGTGWRGGWGRSTEYTQSSNGHFLANIPPWWKIQPRLVVVVGARPPCFTISTITYKLVVYTLAERADILPLFLLYPYMYSVGRGPLLILEREREGKGPERRKIDRLLTQ